MHGRNEHLRGWMLLHFVVCNVKSEDIEEKVW